MAIEFTVLGSGSKGNATLVRLDGRRRAARRGDRAEGAGPSPGASRLPDEDQLSRGRSSTLHPRRSCPRRHAPMAGSTGDSLALPRGARRGGRPPAGVSEPRREGGWSGPSTIGRSWRRRGLWGRAVRHSVTAGPTFGYRLEGRVAAQGGRPSVVGYLTDTGCWDDRVADALADSDLLGVEFNHDVEMERTSGRSPALIWRNLGPPRPPLQRPGGRPNWRRSWSDRAGGPCGRSSSCT